MVGFFKFDRDFGQPVLFTVSLLAVFRGPGVAISEALEAAQEQDRPARAPFTLLCPCAALR